MHLEELPMIIFTTVGQMSVGAFWMLGIIHLLGYARKMSASTIDRLTNAALYACGPLLILGFGAASFHLSYPLNALNSMRHAGSSWLTNEILFGVAYGTLGLIFSLCQWFGWLSRSARQVLAGLTALAGLGLVCAMVGVYFFPGTITTWSTWFRWVLFFGSALVTGPLAVAITIALSWRAQIRNAANYRYNQENPLAVHWDSSLSEDLGRLREAWQEARFPGVWKWFKGWIASRFITKDGVNDELTALTLSATKLSCRISAFAGIVLLIAYPIHAMQMTSGDVAQRHVADKVLAMPWLYVRWVLLALGVVLISVFMHMLMRKVKRPTQKMLAVVTVAFLLIFGSELLGRGLHYEGLWHVGINTSQNWLDHDAEDIIFHDGNPTDD